ncbi:PAS domain S-box protein [Sulfurimonas sp.]
MIQETCTILASKHIYGHAWIVTNNSGKIENFASSDPQIFKLFKDKINSGWIPSCVKKIKNEDKPYSLIDDTSLSCSECPIKDLYKDLYNDRSAFTIELKHKKKIYGYLTISLDNMYMIDYNELALLDEVAGDIAYALHNIEIGKSLKVEKYRYEMAEKIAHLGSWEQSNVDNTLEWSDEVYKIFELDISNKMTLDDFIERVHPEDRDSVSQTFQKSIQEHLPYHITHRILFSDGRIKHVLEHAKHFYDDSNNYISTIGTVQDITKQKNTQEKLIQNENKLQYLLDSLSVGVVVHASDTSIIMNNPKASELLDLNNEQLRGMQAIDTKWNFLDSNEKILEVEEYPINKIISTKKQIQNMLLGIIQDTTKDIVWVLVNGFPIFNDKDEITEVIINFIDITELKSTNELLEQKKKELETIIQEAPNPIAIHNEDGKIIMINKVWEDLTGYSHAEIDTISKWTEKVALNSSNREEHIKSLYSITQRVNEGEFEITTKDNHKIIWAFSSAPLGQIDGKKVLISTAMDITQLKQKDEMLISQSRHAAMGEMISMIAHQWRQPISVIAMDANNMLVDIELDSFNATEAEKYAKSITTQTQHLSETIDDFRNFFKPDRVISQVNIKDILDKTMSIVKDSLANNNIELTSSFETDKEVKAYPRELMQVFVNIITNSKDALTSNKRNDASISIRVYEDEKYINTEVCDNGGGINTDILPKVFDPYFSTKDAKTGTGLGLYMSKMIVEDHLNGIIEARNSDDGACFNIRLLK